MNKIPRVRMGGEVKNSEENTSATDQPGRLQALAHMVCTRHAQVVQKTHWRRELPNTQVSFELRSVTGCWRDGSSVKGKRGQETNHEVLRLSC